ncbi:hypothetical protein GCM10017750_45780 [Streptomyces racemochromogenes]
MVQEAPQVVDVAVRAGRRGGFAEAAQVVADDGVPLREAGHDGVPHLVVGYAGVHEYDGRPVTGNDVREMSEIIGKSDHPEMLAQPTQPAEAREGETIQLRALE